MRKCPRGPAESCRSSWKILEIPSFVRVIRATNSVFYTSQLTPHFHADLTDYMHNEFIWRSQSQSQLRLVAFSSHSIHSFNRIVVYRSGALAMQFKANQHQENQKCRSHFELCARKKKDEYFALDRGARYSQASWGSYNCSSLWCLHRFCVWLKRSRMIK